jgi:hypothetical protein
LLLTQTELRVRKHGSDGRFAAQDAKLRFAAKTKPQANGCLLWIGTVTPDGYGTFSIGKTTWRAHRLAWFWFSGQHPREMCVCHRCDNPICVQPTHLFLGTTQDNIADKLAKGRQRAGEGKRHGSKTHPESVVHGVAHPIAKLNPALVRSARAQAAAGASINGIAARMGVCRATIAKMLRGETWRRVV